MKKTQLQILVVSMTDKWLDRIRRLIPPEKAAVHWEPHIGRVLDHFEETTFDTLLITGALFKDNEIEGIEVLDIIRDKCRVTQVILLVEEENLDLISVALEAGTYQYAKLPADDAELRILLNTALELHPPAGTNLLLKSQDRSRHLGQLIGTSRPMQEVYEQIGQAAFTDIPILLLGETGTGKDLVAQAIHQRSARKDNPYVPVNMGAIPTELISSELFGYERGAFTGALDRHEGKFEQGNTGTVFLDEVGSMDEKVQVSLLRLLESKRFNRLGGKRFIKCDVRLIAATNADLMEQVQHGTFREDLFYRLDVFRIALPPLRERQGDVPLLVDTFVHRFNQEFEKDVTGVGPECAAVLENYRWPGNVRELKNAIQRAVLVCDEKQISVDHLPPRFQSGKPNPVLHFELGTPLKEMERQVVLVALEETANNRKRAAELLGISRSALYTKLRNHGID